MVCFQIAMSGAGTLLDSVGISRTGESQGLNLQIRVCGMLKADEQQPECEAGRWWEDPEHGIIVRPSGECI